MNRWQSANTCLRCSFPVCVVSEKSIFLIQSLGLWSHCRGINKQNCLWVEGIDEDSNILRVAACSRWLHFHMGIAGAAKELRAACGQSSPRGSCRRQSVFPFFSLSVVETEGGKQNYNAIVSLFKIGDAGERKNRYQRLNDFTWQVLQTWFRVRWRFFLKTVACRGVSQLQSRLSHICHMCKTHSDAHAHTHQNRETAARLSCPNSADDHNISAQFKRPTQKPRQMCRLDDTRSGWRKTRAERAIFNGKDFFF